MALEIASNDGMVYALKYINNHEISSIIAYF